MREYLFHGKRTDNGEWVEGYLSYNKARKQYYIMDDVNAFPIPVYEESVGEWTGVCDINQRKIFENDIVRTQPFTDRPYSSKAKSKQHIGVVKYCTPEFYNDHFKQKVYNAKWRVDVKDYGKYVCSSWSDFFDCEVIGNVFENTDLLEG